MFEGQHNLTKAERVVLGMPEVLDADREALRFYEQYALERMEETCPAESMDQEGGRENTPDTDDSNNPSTDNENSREVPPPIRAVRAALRV